MTKRKPASPEYRAWEGIKRRCLNNRDPAYPRYGGRGITMCANWVESFPAFLEDVGAKPKPSLTIERVDNNGNYEPGNCKWATRKEQQNNRRNTPMVSFEGRTLPLAEWSRNLGIPRVKLYARYRAGFPPEKVLSLTDIPRYPVPPLVRGERNGNAKLTSDNVREIRSDVVTHNKELAERYGVTETLIRQVKQNKIWRHVA